MILSTDNPYYKFSLLDKINDPSRYTNKVVTLFVLKGRLSLLIENEIIDINELEGIVLSQKLIIDQIQTSDGSKILEVVSDKKK